MIDRARYSVAQYVHVDVVAHHRPPRARIGTIMVVAVAGRPRADPPSGVVGLAASGRSTGEAHGSGIVVAPGLALTAAHVVKGAKEIDVMNGARSTTATIVAFDPEMDLAYIRPGREPRRSERATREQRRRARRSEGWRTCSATAVS